MKTTLLYSNYNEDTGISNVSILTNLGIFKGKAKLHKEDREIASHFAGCKIAESRAYIKYYKTKIKLIKEQIKGLQHLQNVLCSLKNYNPKSIENRKLRHQIFIKQGEVTILCQKISNIKDSIDKYLEKRIKYIQEEGK